MTDQKEAPVLLYVEDEAVIQLMMTSILGDAGYELIIAGSGEEALNVLETEKGRITGLVTDVDLGKGPTGWNVARRARMLISRIPVIYACSACEDDWMMYGVPLSKLLAKPFRPSRVVDTVSALMASLPGAGSRAQYGAAALLSEAPDDIRETLLARQSAIARVGQFRPASSPAWLRGA